MDLDNRIKAFSELGEILRNTLEGKTAKFSSELSRLIDTQYLKNPWFTPENVRMAVRAVADQLTHENLTKWTYGYPALKHDASPFKVGVIMAGNIPLVGFHDFLSVLMTGNDIIIKTSSKDPDLIVLLSDILGEINPEFSRKIRFAEGTLSGFDAVIATGSNNSSRYFEYYFGRYPSIIRKNRNSIAVIEGSESGGELEALGTDVFSYFGLGCRNVSKIFVPEGFDLEKMTAEWKRFSNLIDHQKYANNYDFSKAVFLVNREKFLDTGFLLLKESKSIYSPVAVLHFEYYKNHSDIEKLKMEFSDDIQCITGREYIPFGKSQFPFLWDYADNTDTIDFLLKKNVAGIL